MRLSEGGVIGYRKSGSENEACGIIPLLCPTV